MTNRLLSDAALAPSSNLVGAPLASPSRRMIGFAFDCMLLMLPSVLVAVGASAISLYFADREAFHAIRSQLLERKSDHASQVATLARIAPLLVRMEAQGLPPSVAVAVEESDSSAPASCFPADEDTGGQA
jgi:hypothetical protein